MTVDCNGRASIFRTKFLLIFPNQENGDETGPQTLLEERLQPRAIELVAPAGTSGSIPWSPPLMNWNPWTASNIDEGYFAVVRLNFLNSRAISEQFQSSFSN